MPHRHVLNEEHGPGRRIGSHSALHLYQYIHQVSPIENLGRLSHELPFQKVGFKFTVFTVNRGTHDRKLKPLKREPVIHERL
jgi:hypothetical protein